MSARPVHLIAPRTTPGPLAALCGDPRAVDLTPDCQHASCGACTQADRRARRPAVDAAIRASGRHGRPIGRREARMIRALLGVGEQ